MTLKNFGHRYPTVTVGGCASGKRQVISNKLMSRVENFLRRVKRRVKNTVRPVLAAGGAATGKRHGA